MADLSVLVGALDDLVRADPAELGDGETVQVVLAQLERLSAVATRAVGAFDAGGEWSADGARSAAAWLATRCRLPRRALHQRVALARRLRHMPLAEDAWSSGSISCHHASVLASARETDAEDYERDEQILVQDARTLRFDGFCRVVDYWRQLADPDGVEQLAERDRQGRRAHLSPGLRGTGFLDAKFDPLGYAAFSGVLGRIEEELFEQDWREGRGRLGDAATAADLGRTPAQRRLDALVLMARRAAAAPPDARLPVPLFTVLVGYETFAGRMCQLAQGTVLTPGSLVPWITEAEIERVVFDAKERPINVGVRQRLFRGATRRAVQVRDLECFHPYCDVPADDCEVDHVQPYSAGGPTTDANGRCACDFHNRRRHQPPGDGPGAEQPSEPAPDRPP